MRTSYLNKSDLREKGLIWSEASGPSWEGKTWRQVGKASWQEQWTGPQQPFSIWKCPWRDWLKAGIVPMVWIWNFLYMWHRCPILIHIPWQKGENHARENKWSQTFFCKNPNLAGCRSVHICNNSTWEAEASQSLWVQGQPGLKIEFQEDSLSPPFLPLPFLSLYTRIGSRASYLLGKYLAHSTSYWTTHSWAKLCLQKVSSSVWSQPFRLLHTHWLTGMQIVGCQSWKVFWGFWYNMLNVR